MQDRYFLLTYYYYYYYHCNNYNCVFQVVGVDGEGYEFQRTTRTAISPVEPSAPDVETDKLTRGYYDEDVILTCDVRSLIPYTVQWYRNAVEIGNKLFYRCVVLY